MRQIYDGMVTRVQKDGEYSEPFPVTNRAVLWHTVQHDVFSRAQRCFSGLPCWFPYQVPLPKHRQECKEMSMDRMAFIKACDKYDLTISTKY